MSWPKSSFERMKAGKLLHSLCPSEYVRSIYEYDFAAAYERGKRLILFDIDNTFVPHGAPADARSLKLIESLKQMGFSLCAVSNNREPRVKKFCDAVKVPYIYKAGKPSASGYRKAAKLAGVPVDRVLFFGDQIFTDIWGANRAGISSVLVKPVDRRTDEIQIVFKRILEKPLIKAFLKEKKLAGKDYFI